MCVLTVLANLLGKSFILLEAEDEFCQAFPVSIIHLLLFLLFCEQRGLGAEQKYFKAFKNLFFMSFTAFRENCHGGTVRFSRTQMLKILESLKVEPKWHMKKKKKNYS